jgi:hypothetical protein
MENQKQDQEHQLDVTLVSDRPSARILDFTARTGLPPGDPLESTPLLPSERRLLRMMLAFGPERILAAVKALETLKHACPTARRELAED